MSNIYTNLLLPFGKPNLSSIHWAHAVNSAAKLKENLLSKDIDFIEGDIQMLQGARAPIMAHPPSTVSDLSFADWIETLSESGKGAKLDFKDVECLEPVFKVLTALTPKVPIILNADILSGPGGGEPVIQPKNFIELCSNLKCDHLLSVGWKTTCQPDLCYTSDMIADMMSLVGAERAVTLPIRAYYLKNSWDALSIALDNHSELSLTIWNNEPVASEDIQWMRHTLDPARTFVDII